LLAFGDEEMQTYLLPMITSTRQEFFVRADYVPLVANQTAYKIPFRAVGRTLRDIKIESDDGQVVYNLAYVMPEDFFSQNFQLSSGQPWMFTVQGDYVIIPPQSLTGYSIKMTYELAPSKLVSSDRAATIANIDTVTGVVTIDAANSNFTTGLEMDFIDYRSGNNCKGIDVENTNVSGTNITFAAADLPSDLAVGDYLTIANETPVLQVPNELTQVLVQAVICRVTEALGDFEGLQVAVARLDKIIKSATQIITPRIESKVPVVINRNGLLPQRSYNRRWRYNL
jgi:hypothetical protein